MRPRDVPREVTLTEWFRWLVRAEAENSRRAHYVFANAEDVSKLPPEIMEAMKWAIQENGE